MIGHVLWAQEPPFPARRIGKCVLNTRNQAVYVFDQPTPFNLLSAYGISETVLVEMIRNDVRLINYKIGVGYRQAERDAVIADGLRDTRPGARRGYLYWPERKWVPVPDEVSAKWVSAQNRLDLVWRIDAPELRDWRARILAARPVAPVQMGLWA